MPSEIKLALEGREHVISLGHKINKEDLYGRVRKVVEANGKELERGYLLPTGQLLRRSQLTFTSVDSQGTCIEEAVAYIDEAAVQITPSSFEQTNPLESVPLTSLVDFCVDDVYQVAVGDLPLGLYQTTFNYRASYQPRAALLLVRSGAEGVEGSEAFLLVGERKAAPFIGRAVSYEFFDAQLQDDGEVDPLDFSIN